MALTTAQLQLIEQRVANEGPSPLVAYLLWGFLGVFSAHRFYLGRPGSAILQICTLYGLGIWWLIDVFLISGMLRQKRDALRQKLTVELMAQGVADTAPAAVPATAA